LEKEIVDVLEKQMQKWRSLKEKREEERKIQRKIKDSEKKLDQVSKEEDYDAAEILQKQINKDMQKGNAIARLIINLEKQRGELEEQIKKLKSKEGKFTFFPISLIQKYRCYQQ